LNFFFKLSFVFLVTTNSPIQQSQSVITTVQNQNNNQVDEQVKYKKQIPNTKKREGNFFLIFFD
jgi:hypothetical protein